MWAAMAGKCTDWSVAKTADRRCATVPAPGQHAPDHFRPAALFAQIPGEYGPLQSYRHTPRSLHALGTTSKVPKHELTRRVGRPRRRAQRRPTRTVPKSFGFRQPLIASQSGTRFSVPPNSITRANSLTPALPSAARCLWGRDRGGTAPPSPPTPPGRGSWLRRLRSSSAASPCR